MNKQHIYSSERMIKSLSVIFFITIVAQLIILPAMPSPTQLFSKSVVEKEDLSLEEPPINHFLADSPWAESHRNSYCQASSPFPGPVTATKLEYAHQTMRFDVPITLSFSEKYPDGKWVIWGSTVGLIGRVFKIDPDTFDFIDQYIPQLEENAPLNMAPSITGAYNILDNNGTFFVLNNNHCGIDAFSDVDSNISTSDIVLKNRFIVPDKNLQYPDDEKIVGITMTYDGMIAFVTNLGTVGVVSRNLSLDSAHYLVLNHKGLDRPEEVSNSLASDEDGGIYVVTDQLMYRVQWTGHELTLETSLGAWTAEYEIGEGQQAGRLGNGSGSTPSLMGTGNQDKFVVLTDGQEIMHLVLMWRDKVPDDWTPIAPGKDIRIAAEIPVTFGDIDTNISYSEQSVLVQGYSAVVVNNRLGWDRLRQLPQSFQPFAMIISNLPGVAPYGIEKFTWNAITRKLTTTWVNQELSLPNGIPSMSTDTGLIYCIGQRNAVWTLEAIRWDTGISAFFYELTPCERDNSFYAATEIGPDCSIYTGTLFGIAQFRSVN